jgi:hypothetical protein
MAVEEDYERAVVRRPSELERHETSAILKEGYLIKRAVKTGANWRKRYIKLYSDFFLGYCENSESAPKGLITLTADHFVADNKLRPFGFHVRSFVVVHKMSCSTIMLKICGRWNNSFP